MISEAVEFIISNCLLHIFLITHFGSNAEMIGNIRNRMWQYTIIEETGCGSIQSSKT